MKFKYELKPFGYFFIFSVGISLIAGVIPVIFVIGFWFAYALIKWIHQMDKDNKV